MHSKGMKIMRRIDKVQKIARRKNTAKESNKYQEQKRRRNNTDQE